MSMGDIVTAIGCLVGLGGLFWTARALFRGWRVVATKRLGLVVERTAVGELTLIGSATVTLKDPPPSWNLAILEGRVAEADRRLREEMGAQEQRLSDEFSAIETRIRDDLDAAVGKWNVAEEQARQRTADDVKDGFWGLVFVAIGAAVQIAGALI